MEEFNDNINRQSSDNNNSYIEGVGLDDINDHTIDLGICMKYFWAAPDVVDFAAKQRDHGSCDILFHKPALYLPHKHRQNVCSDEIRTKTTTLSGGLARSAPPCMG